ncbi:MAG: DUF1499 domain-containing protein [Pseudomonadota bacterium]
MKTLLLIVLVLIALGVAGFFYLGVKSKNGSALGLSNGVLSPCPGTPNCVCSEAGEQEAFAIAPLPSSVWTKLPGFIEQSGGRITTQTDEYIAAEFVSSIFQFVDDVEFRKGDDAVHVRSASRVGRSDLGANAKRIESFRAALDA